MSQKDPDLPLEPKGSNADITDQQGSSVGVDGIESKEVTVYRGWRDPAAPVGEECTVTADNGELDCRYDLLSASPTGFEWGYGGSGPTQLAIAILADAYDNSFATCHYQRFKTEVIATLPEHGWTLTTEDLDEWREVSLDGEV